MAIRLRITRGKGEGKDFVFTQPVVRIGRMPDNDLVLYDTGVSRYHCEILADAEGFTLRDTGSANGTLLNDVLTTEAELEEGDTFQVGPIAFQFAKSSEPPKGRKRRRSSAFAPESTQKRRMLEDQHTQAINADELMDPDDTNPEGPRAPVSVVRTATGSFMAYQRRMSTRIMAVPRGTRIALLSGIGVVLLAVTVSALIIKGRPPPDRSTEIFEIGPNTMVKRFGAGKVDISTPDRVNFRFDYKGGRAVAQYTAGGIESETELQILVNGQPVGFVLRSPGWTRGLRTVLPRRFLTPGANVLTFDNVVTPQQPERWGVYQVQVVEEVLPPVDPVKAKELYDLGRAAFDTRAVAPENLSSAIGYFKDAKLYLEAQQTPSQLQGAIEHSLTTAEGDLTKIYNSHMFSAEKALRFGERDQAADALRELLRYFPDPTDRRHKQIKDRLGKLVGKM